MGLYQRTRCPAAVNTLSEEPAALNALPDTGTRKAYADRAEREEREMKERGDREERVWGERRENDRDRRNRPKD